MMLQEDTAHVSIYQAHMYPVFSACSTEQGTRDNLILIFPQFYELGELHLISFMAGQKFEHKIDTAVLLEYYPHVFEPHQLDSDVMQGTVPRLRHAK